MSRSKTVRDIVMDYLKREGFEGLYCLSVGGTIICDCSIVQDFTNCNDGCVCDTCRPGVLKDGKIVERRSDEGND